MKKKTKLNKAVADSLSILLQEGINVNVRLENATLVKLVFFVILTSAIIAGTNYGLFLLKK